MNEVQKIILTCLLGPEDKTGFKKFCKREREKVTPRAVTEEQRKRKQAKDKQRYRDFSEAERKQYLEDGNRWRRDNKPRVLERERKRRAEPGVRARGKELDKKRRAADPEKYLEQDRDKVEKYRRLNPRAAAEAASRYRTNHPDRANESNRKSTKKRYRSNLKFRLSVMLRNSLGRALRNSKTKKSIATFDLLGCPLVWFEAYLEEQFRPGMTWKNHGPVWHIDHIRPIANFDLTDPEQQRICFHWTNFQPLFAAENISKGAKYVR